ncbi:MAG: tRNA (adenosine(37)-N6)-dimethylallyltransferase MiaA [Bacteroidetes bacterium GWE2_42_24]|nr:MAG: tRNA (adenosine(37)-N6)-dimethylallyltransferase MiaA [Bacteroidetes bacterium GWE2_42_24]OFY30577.1 MAG: tRNA (adenosine(37)-N6)-dimethylallyltransferase MiaA [Bacteroidetes bacterium GWF2_43_11]
MESNKKLIVITGATATGKTKLAVRLAYDLNGEIISADSRQVYRGMNIGTGKDLADYEINGIKIPYHLIDIHEPGHEYNIHDFGHDFRHALQLIDKKGRQPVLCGGSGLYIETAIKGYASDSVPENPHLRDELRLYSDTELRDHLMILRKVHNTTDLTDRTRLIRAIEIGRHIANKPPETHIQHLMIGLKLERHVLRQRITDRLTQRLDEGMINEVYTLLDRGIEPEALVFYGLEYKYLTWYAIGKLSYKQMFSGLNTAIHQFAKRQETWFRRMEKNGFIIHWIDAALPFESVAKAAHQIIIREKA